VPPGGSIDLLARLLADHVANANGVSVIIESTAGAGGIIAAEAAARAAPDGNTLLMNNNGMTSARSAQGELRSPHELRAICNLVSTPQIIVVNGAQPYRTLAELVDAARAKPGRTVDRSVGPQTTQHLGIERFKKLAQANLTYVPYPGGATTLNALIGGHVTSAVLNWSEVGEQVIAGKAAPSPPWRRSISSRCPIFRP